MSQWISVMKPFSILRSTKTKVSRTVLKKNAYTKLSSENLSIAETTTGCAYIDWLLIHFIIHMSVCTTKPTKWHAPSDLGIRPVWSVSSLSARRKLESLATLWVHSEDWSDCADAQGDLSLCWARRSFCWFCHATVDKCATSGENLSSGFATS